MATSIGGHKGGLQLGTLIRLIERTAYRQRHVAFNRVGVKIGLPPDVVTIQLGKPEDGFWWNLKRGMVPEVDVRYPAQVVDDTDVIEIIEKYGMNPIGRMAAAGIMKYADGKSMINEKMFKKKTRAKLLYVGWRVVLISMLTNRQIRGSQEAEALLGTAQYRRIMNHRRLRDTVHYDVL